MKIGVLVNLRAGSADRVNVVCAAVDRLLGSHEVICSLDFGGSHLRADRIVAPIKAAGYLPKLWACVDAIAAESPGAFVVAGGDGLAAYVADRLITRHGGTPRMLGIAMGTANVGPIVAFQAEELDGLKFDDLEFAPCGAIEALDGDRHAAYCFNDLIIGNTLLSTVDKKTATVSAAAMARDGSRLPEDPMESAVSSFKLVKNGAEIFSSLPSVAQIVASTLERDRLYGRAVAGMLCYAGEGAQAAILLSERPIVTTRYDARGFGAFARAEQLLFGAKDDLRLYGCKPEALIIADGNPYLRSGDFIGIRYIPELVAIAGGKGARMRRWGG
ncbi:MAG: hypothetical protein AAGU74_05340 [Bacillota bacterium]